jgi:hypothetical protein
MRLEAEWQKALGIRDECARPAGVGLRQWLLQTRHVPAAEKAVVLHSAEGLA